jgi:hypothetical protein
MVWPTHLVGRVLSRGEAATRIVGNVHRFPLQMLGNCLDEGLSCSVYDYSADQGISSDIGTRLCKHMR